MRALMSAAALLALTASTLLAGESVAVKEDEALARPTPDEAAEALPERARMNDVYVLLERQPPFVKVQYGSEPSWLLESECELRQRVALRRVKTSAPVTSSPGGGSALGSYGAGTMIVESAGVQGQYLVVSYQGKRGYVSLDLLESERGAQRFDSVSPDDGTTDRTTPSPTGDTPTGASPAGASPDSTSPSGASPSSSPSGASPSGASPAGASPSSSPGGASPGGASPGGASPSGIAPSGGDPGAVTPAGARQNPPTQVSQSDLEILARMIKGEALDCPHDGKVAVAAVILNRVRSPGFPKTIAGVAFQGNGSQFNAYLPSVRGRLYYGAVPESCWQAAREAVAGKDPSNGATYYFNPYLVSPSWARKMVQTARIGSNRRDTHVFYKPRGR